MWLWIALACLAGPVLIIGVHGGLAYYLYNAKFEMVEIAPPTALTPPTEGPLAAIEIPAETTLAPETLGIGPDGQAINLSDLRGRVVVLNTWASWCRPCRTELPTLAALDAAYGDELAVVAINVDRTPEEVAAGEVLLAANAPLADYADPTFEIPFRLPGRGAMPQTILIDRQGRMRAWLVGEADWASPEARTLIDQLLAEGA